MPGVSSCPPPKSVLLGIRVSQAQQHLAGMLQTRAADATCSPRAHLAGKPGSGGQVEAHARAVAAAFMGKS